MNLVVAHIVSLFGAIKFSAIEGDSNSYRLKPCRYFWDLSINAIVPLIFNEFAPVILIIE